ncbi:MAG: cobyrinic acid a,c-diamide synthase [Actinomycetota bacterium]
MSRRASLPGAEELFRRTSRSTEAPSDPAARPESQVESRQVAKSTKLQVASTEAAAIPKAPKHDEKVTFYCTGEDLMALERARLKLRSEHGVSADRGRIVRAALAYVLEDFDARGDDAILLRELEH